MPWLHGDRSVGCSCSHYRSLSASTRAARGATTAQIDRSVSTPNNPASMIRLPAQNEASLCQPQFLRRLRARDVVPPGGARGFVVGLVVGSGSDLSEEPAVQDVEPVTLDFVSFLIVLPGLPITARGGERPRPATGRPRWRVDASTRGWLPCCSCPRRVCGRSTRARRTAGAAV